MMRVERMDTIKVLVRLLGNTLNMLRMNITPRKVGMNLSRFWTRRLELCGMVRVDNQVVTKSNRLNELAGRDSAVIGDSWRSSEVGVIMVDEDSLC